MGMVAREIFLTKGVGRHKEKLTSFEMALRDAGIAPYNLVRVSSIFPPRCKLISRTSGLQKLSPGEIVFVVMSDNATNEPNRLISASVGLALPTDPDHYGYLSEHHAFGQTEKAASDYAEDVAAYMLATTLGVEVGENYDNLKYDEKKEIWKFSEQIIKTRAVTQSAIGDKNGLWTAVIAAAVLIG